MDETPETDGGERLRQVQRWYETDIRGVREWRDEAEEAYRYRDGDQWSEEDRAKLRAEMRPCITMNEIAAVIETVAGSEINAREEISLKPREEGDSAGAEAGSMLIEHIRDACDAEDEESEAFRDLLTAGVGCIEVYVDPETRKAKQRRVDPFEMVWPKARLGRNLNDSPRLMRVREIDREEAEAMFPDAAAGDLDATWVSDVDGAKRNQPQPGNAYAAGDSDGDLSDTVRVVECQWIEEETLVRLTNPLDGSTVEADPADIENTVAEMLAGVPPEQAAMVAQSVTLEPLKRKVVVQGFYGAKELEFTKLPVQGVGMTWKVLTGKYDRDKGIYYGMVRGMIDPQQWANKWLSQALHILNTSAKNTLLHEEGAFPDKRDLERRLTKPGAVVEVSAGAITGGKFMWKDSQGFPQGFFDLIQYASMMVRKASGVNPELMGLAEGEQAGVLEYQRKQAAMQTLAPYFDGLRRARKDIGRALLKFAVEYMLPTGEAARIIGEQRAAFLQAMMAPGFDTYDVVVEEAPSSPSVKDRSWAAVQQALPIVLPMAQSGQIPPAVLAAMFQTMPLPAAITDQITKALTQPPDPQVQAQQQQQMEMQMRALLAKVLKDEAAATKMQAETEKLGMETQLAPLEAAASVAAQADNAEQRVVERGMNREDRDADREAKTGMPAPQRSEPRPSMFGPPMPIPVPQMQPAAPQPDPQLQQAMTQMAQGLGGLSRDIRALIVSQSLPKRVIRDEMGNVVGVEAMRQ